MATITSTETGNWHATGTWAGGSIPANNDLVVIAHGDRVTLSTDITSAITDNVTINGNLHFASGAKMHLNGRMTVNNTTNSNNTAGEYVLDDSDSGSLLSMVGGSEIKISGDNAAQHGIQIADRKWCGVQIDGSEPTLKTELNDNHPPGAQFLTVADSTNFTANDLISIYRREEDFRLANDECLYIHDVDHDNNRLYFRQFVGPEATIISSTHNTIKVDDARGFRVGYRLIFGTGSSRNILRVTGINNSTNVITFESTIDNLRLGKWAVVGGEVGNLKVGQFTIGGRESTSLTVKRNPSLKIGNLIIGQWTIVGNTVGNLVIGEYTVEGPDAAYSNVGLKVYQTGTEKFHLDNSEVRRTSSAMAATYSGATNLRTVEANNVSDFSIGDKIYIEACGDNSFQYVSGGETNVWRHRLVYTITAIIGTTITVDRDILYDGKIGGKITRMTRDVVIKACAANGDEVAYADQDTARVFFNVKYWTSTTANNAPTRRVKIKYVEFSGLGYNTNDSTNFRQGVNIAGYNGYYDTKVAGSTGDADADDYATIHTTGGVSQTGENYLDGCTYSSYNLYSNTTRDGDSYGSICIRHPYGMVTRNCVIIGAARGIWHWSSQYYVKSHGHITAANNYTCAELGAAYERLNEYSYFYLRMCEDYGILWNHLGRQNDMTILQHFDVQYMQSYMLHHGYGIDATMRRFHFDKYRYSYIADSTRPLVFQDSRFLPNYWDGSSKVYGLEHIPNYDGDAIRHNTTDHLDPELSTGAETGKIYWIEHGFKQDEYVEMGNGMTKLNRNGSQIAEMMVSPNATTQNMNRIFVPAATTVNLRSKVFVNLLAYDGATNTVDDNSLPVLIARSKHNSGFGGRHSSGVVTDTPFAVRDLFTDWNLIQAPDDSVGIKSSHQVGDNLQQSFVDFISHTSSAQGAWEIKDLTIAPQPRGYELAYGFYVDSTDIAKNGFKAFPIEVLMSNRGPAGSSHLTTGTLGKTSIRSSFTTNKKRISGRI